jgi:tetratricopeptide (TPR) repeat protein
MPSWDNAHTKATVHMAFSAFVVFSIAPASLFAQAPAQRQQPEFIRQGQQLMREGKMEEALALYRQTLQSSPLSLPANIAAGNVLDLLGRGEQARKYFQKAADIADTPEQKASAHRSMAMSYAFEGSCKKAVEYEQKVFDYYAGAKDSSNKEKSRTKPPAFALIPAIWIPPCTGIRSVMTPG